MLLHLLRIKWYDPNFNYLKLECTLVYFETYDFNTSILYCLIDFKPTIKAIKIYHKLQTKTKRQLCKFHNKQYKTCNLYIIIGSCDLPRFKKLFMEIR